jgi:hypothetical protein
MHQKVRDWLDALRSDRYEQGRGTLKKVTREGRTTYCCFGVLCELENPRWVVKSESYGTKLWEFWLIPDGLGTHSMPYCDFLDSLGIGQVQAREWAELNDAGWSFSQIANQIERQLAAWDQNGGGGVSGNS